MPYNFAADSFHTKKLCSRLSSSEVHFLIEIGRFAFLRPPLGDLGATYDDHLRLIGKRVLDFLLALTELFSLGITAEALRAIIGWKSAIFLQRGPVDPKFQVEGVAPTNHSSSSFIWYINLDRSLSGQIFLPFCHNSRVWRTDGQTDRILIARPRLHSMQRGKNHWLIDCILYVIT